MKHLLLALAFLSLAPATSFLASEVWQAENLPKPAAYTSQDTAALQALIDKPDDILERGRKNATARSGRPYTQKEAALLIARIWNVEVSK